MKNFLAIYLGTGQGIARWKSMAEPERKQRERSGMDAWAKWVNDNQTAIVAIGAPLGKTKRISRQGTEDTKNNITGYAIVQAESHEAAAELFEGHPHFTIFPGDSVEVMECLPLPSN